MAPYILMATKQAASDEFRSKNRKGQRTCNAFYGVFIEPTFFDFEALAPNDHWLLFTNAIILPTVGFFSRGSKSHFHTNKAHLF